MDGRRSLGFNPHDEEVRAALGRLPRGYLYRIEAGLYEPECVEGVFCELRL